MQMQSEESVATMHEGDGDADAVGKDLKSVRHDRIALM